MTNAPAPLPVALRDLEKFFGRVEAARDMAEKASIAREGQARADVLMGDVEWYPLVLMHVSEAETAFYFIRRAAQIGPPYATDIIWRWSSLGRAALEECRDALRMEGL